VAAPALYNFSPLLLLAALCLLLGAVPLGWIWFRHRRAVQQRVTGAFRHVVQERPTRGNRGGQHCDIPLSGVQQADQLTDPPQRAGRARDQQKSTCHAT
jgi:hypothetical protein